METRAVVISLDGEYAVVRTDRKSACDGCHKQNDAHGCAMCTLMGDKASLESRARNLAGAHVGDTVLLRTPSSRVLGYSALVFLFPLGLALLLYLAAGLLPFGSTGQYLAAACGFAGAFALLAVYSRRVIAPRCDAAVVSVLSSADPEEETTRDGGV